jgi:O-antigen ligase
MFLGNALINLDVKKYWHSFINDKHALLLTGIFIIYFITYFWSTDKSYWALRTQVVSPFFILPFAFKSICKWELKHYNSILIIFISLTLGGICWSLFSYLHNKEMYDVGYGFSKVLPTPFKSDHIRFSIAVVLCCSFLIALWGFSKQLYLKILLLLVFAICAIYIHILAVKTGLLAFYLLLIFEFLKYAFSKRSIKNKLILFILFISFPILMYQLSDTLKMKIHYIQYSILEIKNNTTNTHISDNGRLTSYNYAIDIIKKKPILGVGFGDIMHEMKQYYKPNDNIILPHNQFLMLGTSAGILAMLFLVFLILYQLKFATTRNPLFIHFWLIMLLAFMVEPMLETQYGTCLYLFFLLLILKRNEVENKPIL